MIFDGKPTDKITVDELRQLVDEHIPEGKHLDYKRAPYPPSDSGTKELLKDVTAFANTDGGYLIIGVDECDDRQPGIFVNVVNADRVRRSCIDRCLAGIDPRLPGLDVGVFNVDGIAILVVHVPESDRKPHCARPDAEHHYFWRRYEDGNKLMSTAEIRQCLEGDRTRRELAELNRQIAEMNRGRTISRELDMEVNEGTFFELTQEEPLLRYVECNLFRPTVGDTPYYRLWATPVLVNRPELRDHQVPLTELLRSPPKLRNHGWDLTPVGDFQPTALGLVCTRTDYHHLRLLWNGHLEFWTRADNQGFHWDEFYRDPPYRFLFPLAIIEPAACFARLLEEVCRIADYHDELRLGIGLYNIEGQLLLPGAPGTFDYMAAASDIGQPWGRQPFQGQDLIAAPVSVRADDLPGVAAWKVVSRLYQRFGHGNDQIPFFDAERQFALGDGA